MSASRSLRTPRRRGGPLAGVLVLVSALFATACGVPTSSNPIIDKPIQQNANGQGIDDSVSPPAAGTYADPRDFVLGGYLSAIVGANSGTDETSAAKSYMLSALANGWKPPPQITVVRNIDTPQLTDGPANTPGVEKVDGNFDVIGTFDPVAGTLSPRAAGVKSEVALHFETTRQDNGTLLLSKAPASLMISDAALTRYYATQTVYLWDSDRTNLIPDLRYVPLSLFAAPARVATRIVTWVLDGAASTWVDDAAAGPFAPGLELIDPVLPVKNGTYQVDLQANAGALSLPSLNLLAYQLRWSLGALRADRDDLTGPVPSPVQILINGSSRLTENGDGFYQNVPNMAPVRSRSDPIQYVIAGGHVYRVDNQQMPTVFSGKNSSVVSAAVNSGETEAAVVRTEAGAQRLWIHREAGSTTTPFVRVTGLPATGLSKPQFLLSPANYLAIAAGGRLYLVGTDNQAHAVPNPPGIAVDAFSVAPDSQRVALVSHGQLYLSVLANITTGSRSLTTPYQIDIGSQLTTASLVSWASMRELAVVGQSTTGAELVSVNANGAGLDLTHNFGDVTFSQISTYVFDPDAEPAVPDFPSDVLLEISNGAFRNHTRYAPLTLAGKSTSAPFFQD